MNNEQRVTVRLPSEVVDQLKQLSDQRGVSMSKIMRDLLKKYLDRLY